MQLKLTRENNQKMKRTLLIALLICIGNNINAQKKIETEGITSPTHQKYLNKIVFSSDFDPTLSKSNEIEANFKSEFEMNAASKINFRAYFDNSIYNYLRPIIKGKTANDPYNYALGFNFYIDNTLLDKITSNYDKEFPDVQKQTWTTYRGTLKTSEIGKNLGQKQFKEVLDNYTDLLSKGKHKIKVEIYPLFINPDSKEIIKGNTIASGEFTLDIKNAVFNADDENLCLGKNIMKDSNLIQKIVKTYKPDETGFKITSNEVRLLSESWKTERNKYSGAIERRSLYILIAYKNKSGCFKKYYNVYQEYIGSKFSDEMKFEMNLGEPTKEINCKCINQ